ncbi:MAG: hypothetical protein KF705_16980 [Phycisphaeraceae bacterium]|nr:hypothetical protein [Phycisphaeraceae bacterium]
MPLVEEPRGVTKEIDARVITGSTDAKTRARAMAMKLPLAKALTQRRRVEQPTEFTGAQLPGISGHGSPPAM